MDNAVSAFASCLSLGMEITTWSAEALATFAASALAAVIGAASLISGLLEARAARRRLDEVTRREQWWVRWTWAAERLVDSDDRVSALGAIVMEALNEMPWVMDDDMSISGIVGLSPIFNGRPDKRGADVMEEPDGRLV